MTSDIGVGDSELVTLQVAPADGTTQVTLTVEPPPTGDPYEVTMTAGTLTPIDGSTDFSQVWTSDTPVSYDQAGHWVLHYEVTGTGEGSEDLDVYVVASPVAGGPTWLPGRSRVANYVPHRTLARSVGSTVASADVYQLTFDSTTVPTGVQTDRLIADGAAWVTGRVGTLAPSLYDMASVVVSLYAGAAIERSWPDDEQSLQRANDMERRMDTMLAALVDANDTATGGGGIDIVYPVYSYPAADLRWDSNCYW